MEVVKTFYPSKKIKEYFTSLNSVKEGDYFFFSPEGEKLISCAYSKGKLSGKYLSKIGGEKIECEFLNGVPVGEYSISTLDPYGLVEGDVTITATFEKGKLHGDVTVTALSGIERITLPFEDGKCLEWYYIQNSKVKGPHSSIEECFTSIKKVTKISKLYFEGDVPTEKDFLTYSRGRSKVKIFSSSQKIGSIIIGNKPRDIPLLLSTDSEGVVTIRYTP